MNKSDFCIKMNYIGNYLKNRMVRLITRKSKIKKIDLAINRD